MNEGWADKWYAPVGVWFAAIVLSVGFVIAVFLHLCWFGPRETIDMLNNPK